MRVHFGSGTIKALGRILRRGRFRSVFLVTGRESYERSGARRLIERQLASVPHVRFSNFKTNPRLEDVINGVTVFRRAVYDVVVAVGGGSVIDMAKLVKVIGANDIDPAACVRGESAIADNGVPLIAIPTTSGSGSESTSFAVVYVGREKYSFDHPALRPSAAIIDPLLTHSLSAEQTACTGLDALAQAVESFWSVHSMPRTRRWSRRAARLILAHLGRAVRSPDDRSRAAMSRASFLAGRALSVTRSTAAHAYSYYLTSQFGLAHGHAVAVLLGPVFYLNCDATGGTTDPRGPGFVGRIMRSLMRQFGLTTREDIIPWFASYISSLGLNPDVFALGLADPTEMERFFQSVNRERLKNNPVGWEPGRLESALRSQGSAG